MLSEGTYYWLARETLNAAQRRAQKTYARRTPYRQTVVYTAMNGKRYSGEVLRELRTGISKDMLKTMREIDRESLAMYDQAAALFELTGDTKEAERVRKAAKENGL